MASDEELRRVPLESLGVSLEDLQSLRAHTREQVSAKRERLQKAGRIWRFLMRLKESILTLFCYPATLAFKDRVLFIIDKILYEIERDQLKEEITRDLKKDMEDLTNGFDLMKRELALYKAMVESTLQNN